MVVSWWIVACLPSVLHKHDGVAVFCKIFLLLPKQSEKYPKTKFTLNLHKSSYAKC